MFWASVNGVDDEDDGVFTRAVTDAVGKLLNNQTFIVNDLRNTCNQSLFYVSAYQRHINRFDLCV